MLEQEHEYYTIMITWQPGFTSPLIGIFQSNTSANRYATKLRKLMRAKGKAFKQVKVVLIVPLHFAEFWIRPDPPELVEMESYR